MEPYQLMIFLMYLIVGIFLLIRAFDELNVSKPEKNVFIVTILFSTPVFAGAIERANIILYVIAFLVLALYWKDSGKRWKREAALILIAISAGIKLYPAVFGLIYLKEKRWGEVLRLIIYGLIIFFLPFAFFGGFPSIIQYFKILINLMGKTYIARFQFITGVLNIVGINGLGATICAMLFTGCLIAAFFLSPQKTRRMSYIAALMTFVPGNAFRYSLMFFLIPLFILIDKEGKICKKEDYINAILLGLVFTIPVLFGCVTGFKLKNEAYSYSYVELRMYIFAWLYLGYQFICDICDGIKLAVARLK